MRAENMQSLLKVHEKLAHLDAVSMTLIPV